MAQQPKTGTEDSPLIRPERSRLRLLDRARSVDVVVPVRPLDPPDNSAVNGSALLTAQRRYFGVTATRLVGSPKQVANA